MSKYTSCASHITGYVHIYACYECQPHPPTFVLIHTSIFLVSLL